jgi:hypothetical protein
MALDSDIGNSILPYVRFYQKEVKHEFNSEKEGRPIILWQTLLELRFQAIRFQ